MPEDKHGELKREPRPEESSEPRSLSSRDLQENASEGELEVEPGSDADQANEVPHVG